MALDMDALILGPMFDALAVPAAYRAPGTVDYLPVPVIFGREAIPPDDDEEATGALVPFRDVATVQVSAFPVEQGPEQGGQLAQAEVRQGRIPPGTEVFLVTDSRADGKGLLVLALATDGEE